MFLSISNFTNVKTWFASRKILAVHIAQYQNTISIDAVLYRYPMKNWFPDKFSNVEPIPVVRHWSASTHARERRGCKDYSHSIEPHCAPAHATLSHLLITAQLLTRVHLERHHLHRAEYRVLS